MNENRQADWSGIQGHEPQLRRLNQMLAQRRLPHALLFAGISGIGKRLAADRLATALLLSSEGSTAEVRSHPDYIALEPEKNRVRIDPIREVQRLSGLTAVAGGYRICIIDGADCMEAPAANSLLKILEEPPPDFLFVLITAFPDSLPVTLRSRSAACLFAPLPFTTVSSVLQSRGVGEAEADVAAKLSGGSVGEALFICRPDVMLLRNNALDALENSRERHGRWLWPLVDSLDEAEDFALQMFIKCWIYSLRDMALLLRGGREGVANAASVERLQALAGATTLPRIAATIQVAEETRRLLLKNANTRLMTEALLIRSSELLWGGRMDADCSGGPV